MVANRVKEIPGRAESAPTPRPASYMVNSLSEGIKYQKTRNLSNNKYNKILTNEELTGATNEKNKGSLKYFDLKLTPRSRFRGQGGVRSKLYKPNLDPNQHLIVEFLNVKTNGNHQVLTEEGRNLLANQDCKPVLEDGYS